MKSELVRKIVSDRWILKLSVIHRRHCIYLAVSILSTTSKSNTEYNMACGNTPDPGSNLGRATITMHCETLAKKLDRGVKLPPWHCQTETALEGHPWICIM